MPSTQTPTYRSILRHQALGWTMDRVERQVMKFLKRDFCGLFDVIGFKAGCGFIGIQATDWTSLARHVDKWALNPHLGAWLDAGGVAEIHAWRRGKKPPTLKVWRAAWVPGKIRAVQILEVGRE